MIVITEEPSVKLPNLTSLFVKVPFINSIVSEIEQQEIFYKDKKTGIYELPVTRLFFLINLLIKYDDIKFKPHNILEKPLIKLENYNFSKEPYPHQIEGIEFGLNHDGWLLLDDQGLGKTFQIICLADYLRKTNQIKKCLIICGVNGLKYNWQLEVKKFLGEEAKILGYGLNSKGKPIIKSVEERVRELREPIEEFFVITNIETLQSDKFLEAFKKSSNDFGMIVLDEAHKAKSAKSKAAKTLLKLESPHNIALTGTVITNKPDNLYVPLKWTGNLHCTKGMFEKMYNVYGGFNNAQVIGYKNLDLLREHLATCSLRRLKSQVLNLPERIFETQYVELDPKQRKFYNDIEKGIAEELDLINGKLSLIQEMTINMRLRQATAWPGILSSSEIPSAKLDRLEELVEDILNNDINNKILIFSTFKATVPEVERRLKQYNPVICTGDTIEDDINSNVNKFQTDLNTRIMVATWQKMGTGLNLTAANYIIFIDTPWNDSDFKQACDRCYRIGQDKTVVVITLISKDTYDERVQEILTNKEVLSNYIIDNIDSNSLTQIKDI